MASEVKLKPCPFCGGDANQFADHALSIENEAECVRSFVVCQDCPAIVSGATMTEAAAAWNRRATDAD